MAKKESFWWRTMRRAGNKYLGFDIRIVPLAGIIGLIISIILVNALWLKLTLGYGVLIVIAVCFILAECDIWKEDNDAIKELVKQVELQKRSLLDNPNSYLSVRVKRIIVYDQGYMTVELFVTNGTIYNLKLDWEAKQTTCETIDGVDMTSVHFPQFTIKKKVLNLPAGRIEDQLQIEQEFPETFITQLKEAVKKKVVKWKFGLSVTFSFDSEQKTEPFYPEWEGIHDRIF